jgi:hypothetical protein
MRAIRPSRLFHAIVVAGGALAACSSRDNGVEGGADVPTDAVTYEQTAADTPDVALADVTLDAVPPADVAPEASSDASSDPDACDGFPCYI